MTKKERRLVPVQVIPKSRRGFIIATCIVLALLFFGTIDRNRTWQSKWTLQFDMVEKSPRKLRPWLNLGQMYHSIGQMDKAVEQYRTVLKLCSEGVDQRAPWGSVCDAARSNIAAIALDRGDIATGRKLLEESITGSPKMREARINLAVLQLRTGQAMKAWETLEPLPKGRDHPEIEINRGEVLRGMGRCDEAEKHYAFYRMWRPEYKSPACVPR